MLQINSLAFDYCDTPLWHSVQLSLARGQLLHLRGSNGAGKTTLLRVLAGLLLPTKGSIYRDNQSIHADLASYQKDICYVGHKTGLSPELSIRENAYFDWHWPRCTLSMTALLEEFSLHHVADKPCYQLSEGQQHRASLLRIAMTNASLWLLDEPLAALDNASIMALMIRFKQHLASNGMIIMTSHQVLPADFGSYEEYVL